MSRQLTSGLIRVTVAAGHRSVDLVLPGAVPVAELLPELARCVGLLDADRVHGGFCAVTAHGLRLVTDTGLVDQGIADGAHLSLVAGVDEPPPRVYDDVVEAMSDVVERDLAPWHPDGGRRTALVAASLLLLLGAIALHLQAGSALAGLIAVAVATALVGAATLLSRAWGERQVAVGVGWLGSTYAAVGGWSLVQWGGERAALGVPLAAAGVGALVAGSLTAVGLTSHRALALPPALAGALLTACGLLINTLDVRAGVVFGVALVAVVVAGGWLPQWALAATDLRVVARSGTVADPREPGIDADQVAADARSANEILLAVSAAVGLLLLWCAPLTALLGPSGLLVVVLAAGAVMLRTRQHRTGSQVLVALTSAILALGATAVTLLWARPEWRGVAAVVLAAAGAALLVCTVTPAAPSLRRARWGDLAESTALLALLPSLAVATGLLGAIG